MRHEVVLGPEAVADYRRLSAFVRAQARDTLESHLRHEPTKESRSRIRRPRGLARPQYRLRVGAIRVYYDVTGSAVEVLAIVPKAEAERWLAPWGESE